MSKSKILKPRRIRLEASTACQLKCPSCPTATGEIAQKIGIGFLKFNDFKHILDENPWVSLVELSNWGEIFLNTELLEIMEYAHKNHVSLFADNGVNLIDVTDEVLDALVRYKFKRISCSIDGASQETYSRYRVQGRFQRVIENVKKLNAIKARYHFQFPLMKWQFIAFEHNKHEISEARKMAAELNMEFSVKLSWEDLYSESFAPVKDPDSIRKETDLGAGNRREFREKYGKEYTKDCCVSLWSSPQINYDGRVLGCTVNYWDDYGNAFKDGLEICLNNDRMNYAREMLMGRRTSKKGIPCTQCGIYKSMKDNRTWLKNGDIREGFARNRVSLLLDKNILAYESIKRLTRLFFTVRRLVGRKNFVES